MTLKELTNSAKFTILLGKNGSGKSTFLRTLDSEGDIETRYISPERGGTLKYDPNVDNNMASNETWLTNTRRKNRFEQFRQQSAAQFRNLEVLILREIEKDATKRADSGYTFDSTLEKINKLLPAINLERSDRGFSIQSNDGNSIVEDEISSGESELIALAIELLVFSRSEKADKILLLDEPDVHLHPDLQQKFIEFVETEAKESDLKIVLATHSTALIGAFSDEADVQIVPISKRDQTEFNTFKRSKVTSEILPIFGAHPLSSIFNKSPIVLVEGEDDKRVIDQIVRSSNGRISCTPCVVGTVSEFQYWETWLNDFIPVLYEDAKAFSLRDLDSSEQADICDSGIVCRIRLNCYAMENLLLSDELLESCEASESILKERLEGWAEQFPQHCFADEVKALVNNFENRRTTKVKNLRNIIVALLGTNKPWEVLVGQTIANNVSTSNGSDNSIKVYLGDKMVEKLIS